MCVVLVCPTKLLDIYKVRFMNLSLLYLAFSDKQSKFSLDLCLIHLFCFTFSIIIKVYEPKLDVLCVVSQIIKIQRRLNSV